MKALERLALVAVASAYSGYLVHHAARVRTEERCCRLAAGESAFERTRRGRHQQLSSPKPKAIRLRAMAHA